MTDDRYAIRFPPGMYERVKQHAARHRRTINSDLLWMVEAALAADERTPEMSTTTSYGTWSARAGRFSARVADTVAEALGDFASDYDVAGVAAAYRDAINKALPDGVTLAGEEFYGPHPARAFSGFPVTEDGELDIKAIVEGVDFWAVAGTCQRAGVKLGDRCEICDVDAEERTCARCGATAVVVDCGHHAQPAAISGTGSGEALCDSCAQEG